MGWKWQKVHDSPSLGRLVFHVCVAWPTGRLTNSKAWPFSCTPAVAPFTTFSAWTWPARRWFGWTPWTDSLRSFEPWATPLSRYSWMCWETRYLPLATATFVFKRSLPQGFSKILLFLARLRISVAVSSNSGEGKMCMVFNFQVSCFPALHHGAYRINGGCSLIPSLLRAFTP